ncbi:decapping and exoribonuclease protein [Solenopsis invicta]|uniref:decapping and exoribonuclease protein n=1 Tax=Solenopsis invicta TaxID=13686 RepID=UPI000595B8A2|nr:decapping and exoribonuclease protein [Solenopsis invicta]
MSFQIDFVNFSQQMIPTLTIELIGHYSINGNSQYLDNLSQLKYYVPPSNPNNVNFDLIKNFESTHHKSTEHTKLDNLLRWISNHFDRLDRPLSTQKERWLDIDFIFDRGAIKTILSSPYKKNDGWIICASKYRGTIYLCKFYTDKKEYQEANRTLLEQQTCSSGYKFEQYMVADHPAHKPDPSLSLNECEEFLCMFKAKFGNHSLLYSAEIDGIVSQQFITDTLIGKTFEIIELKTFPMYNKNGDIFFFSQERISEWWNQSYLADIKRIICGLKDKNNIVRMIKEYPVCSLPKLPKWSCDMNRCKIFCNRFLNKIKRIVIKDHNECMYKFHWNPSTKNVVNYNEEAPDHEKYFFLKPWFVDKAEEYKKHSQ